MDVFAPARAGIASLGGEAGAFASDADGRALFCEKEDELFPSASVIKLPLVMTLYADAARGLLDLGESVAVGDRVDGSGVLRHMRDVDRLSLRDLAMLTLLARLGLRAGEVAALRLDDIDWRRGEITVRGKGNRHDRLPLPADAGQRIVDYLHDGRPEAAQGRTVFVRAQAPYRALTSNAVTTVVAAFGRAGARPKVRK